jgi:hypothetical protein
VVRVGEQSKGRGQLTSPIGGVVRLGEQSKSAVGGVVRIGEQSKAIQRPFGAAVARCK